MLKALKIGVIFSLIVLTSFTGVMYAFDYSVKTEVIHRESFKIGAQQQTFSAFYLSAPAALFEVTLSVSQGTIKWNAYSATLLESAINTPESQVNDATYGTLEGWECETANGAVKWRIDQESLNQIWYLSFINDDSYEKEVTVEVTKVWSQQNIQDWT